MSSPVTSNLQWYVLVKGDKKGPLSEAEVVAMMDSAIVTPDALAWHAGAAGWTRLGDLIKPKESPPPEPPVATVVEEPVEAPAVETTEDKEGERIPTYFSRGGAGFQVPAPVRKYSVWLLAALGVGIVLVLGFMNSGDKEPPKYSIRLLREATEVEVAGDINKDITGELKSALDANTNVKTIHLNASVDSLGQGLSLFRLIKDKHLDTYVSSACSSSCAVAFAAGAQRWLNPAAHLSVPSLGGDASQGAQDVRTQVRQALQSAGWGADLIAKMDALAPGATWEPTRDQLLSGNVTTGISTAWQFAMSGLGPNPTLADVTTFLLVNPVLAALNTANPDVFQQVATVWFDNYRKGMVEKDVYPAISQLVQPIRQQAALNGDDESIIERGVLMRDDLRALLERNPAGCYALAKSPASLPEMTAGLPQGYQDRQASLDAHSIKSAKPRDILGQEEAGKLISYISGVLRQKVGDRVSLLVDPQVPAAKYGDVCSVYVTLYDQILELNQDVAAKTLRTIFSGH